MKITAMVSPPVVASLVFLLLCAGALVQTHKNTVPADLTSRSIPAQQAFWRERIATIGGSAAYEEFARSISALSPQQQHSEAHIFGGALYEAEGTDGLAVCDSRFSFGCFHEFLGEAIANLGIGIVMSLNEGCKQVLGDNSLSCQHGIGHGVLAYLGYTDADLNKALGICKSLPYSDPIGGCYAGVFMEYNLQTMLGVEGHVRQAPEGDMQFPCDAVSASYKSACYFWQPQWWHQSFMSAGMPDGAAVYARVGALCAQVPAAYTRTCYEGIGNYAPASTNFDPAQTRALCEAASSDATDQLYCKSLAADSLFDGGAGKKGDSLAVCQGLTGTQYAYCATYANNKANIAVPLMVDEEGIQ